jgi:hypothetical protein
MQAQNIRPSFKCFLTLYRRYEVRKVCCIVLIAMCMPAVNHVHADTLASDKFRIALGGYSVYRYDSVMSLTDSNLGAGISISPEDTLGLKTEQSVVRLDGHYRFTDEDALTYSWYRIKSNGIKSLQESFDWIDENGNPITIPVGAVVDTALDYDILKLGYLWSFYHTDKVELAVGAGLHITRIAVGLRSDTTSSGVGTRDVSTSLPLPVLSFSIQYKVTPKFGWYIKSEFFTLKFDKWDGTYTDTTLGMEYRLFDNIGLGVALAGNALKVTENAASYTFQYDNRVTGILFNVAAYF